MVNSISEIEENNVHKIYDIISDHFDTTRKVIWPKVNDFIESFDYNSTILDIGCGNGKNMGTRADCNYIGLDSCQKLLDIAKKKKNCSYIFGNCLNLPFKNNTFNYAMSIAVIHHLSTTTRRLKCIQEIERILKKKGKALLYVWSFEQEKFKDEKNQDVSVKWKLQKNKKTNTQETILYRYYHLFKKNELENMILECKNLKIIESGNQYNNWYCIIEKI